jgi:hypothetical protein
MKKGVESASDARKVKYQKPRKTVKEGRHEARRHASATAEQPVVAAKDLEQSASACCGWHRAVEESHRDNQAVWQRQDAEGCSWHWDAGNGAE